MAHQLETVIISCDYCGAKFKIRNAQPGAEFPCNRCQKIVHIPEDLIITQRFSTANIEKILESVRDKNIDVTGSSVINTSKQLSESKNTEEQKLNAVNKNIEVAQTVTETQKQIPEILKIELAIKKENPTESNLSLTQRITSEQLKNSIVKQEQEISEENIAPEQHLHQQKRIFASDIENRQRLLYLISLYTRLATKDKKGVWIRKLPLQVFMFEGIIAEIFDWDYAPASIFHSEGRSFINISQEGEEDLLALLSSGYVSNLKLTTNQHRNLTTYQITEKGLKIIEKMSESSKKTVEQLVNCPRCQNHLFVHKKGDTIILYCGKKGCGYERISTITIAEDVSYFCIPHFMPSLSKFLYKPTADLENRLKNYFSQHPQDNIKDTLEELIYLSQVKVLISEWLPFGSNHLAALNYKLGSHERVQSAKFTQEIDCSPSGTLVEIPESLTLVKVRDYQLADYVDFEAISHLPEDPEIVQVEEFAVHINSLGYVRYGLEILAINDRHYDKVSLDHLPRLLVDVLQDSTKIMDTLLTNYQKSLLDLVFQGKSQFRDKYFFILAKDLHCFEQKDNESMASEMMRILTQPNYQDELNQVTEEVKETAIFQDGTVLILGSHGSILVTPTPEKYAQLISDFLFAMDIEIFLNNFFTRLFLMNDELKDIQKLIKNCEVDPTAVSTVQKMLSRTSSDAILMSEVRGYLEEAMEQFEEDVQKRYSNCPSDMQEILQTLRIIEMSKGLKIRIQDIQKIIQGTKECLKGLSQIIEVINERQMRRIQEALSNNTRSLEDITKTNERSGMSLRILEIILAGSLAFNIMDQFTGDWSTSDDAPIHQLLQPIFDAPGIWLACSLLLWLCMGLGIFLFMRWLENLNLKAIATRLKLDIPCNRDLLKKYLQSKNLITHDSDNFTISNIIKVAWEEEDKGHWLGNKPKIELVYDEKNGFILSALIEVVRPTNKISSKILQEIFLSDLKIAGVLKRNIYI